jgi:hypothetical protein
MNIFRIAGKLIEDFKEGATFKAFFQKRILFFGFEQARLAKGAVLR